MALLECQIRRRPAESRWRADHQGVEPALPRQGGLAPAAGRPPASKGPALVPVAAGPQGLDPGKLARRVAQPGVRLQHGPRGSGRRAGLLAGGWRRHSVLACSFRPCHQLRQICSFGGRQHPLRGSLSTGQLSSDSVRPAASLQARCQPSAPAAACSDPPALAEERRNLSASSAELQVPPRPRPG